MNGLAIIPKFEKIDERTDGAYTTAPVKPYDDNSQFTLFFLPVLKELGNYYWYDPHFSIFNGGCFPGFNLLKKYYKNKCFPPGTLLPNFAPFIIDDWATFIGFTKPIKSPEKYYHDIDNFVRAREIKELYKFLSDIADICIFNVDATWWELYSKDESIILRLNAYLIKLPDIQIDRCYLIDREV